MSQVDAASWGLHPTGPARGSEVAARANATFDALLSSNSGSTEPPHKVKGTLWEDTSTNTLKRWDGTAWRAIALLDNFGAIRLQKQTINNAVSAIDFSLPAGYDEFTLRAINVRGSTPAFLAMRVSTNGGASYLSSSDYRVQSLVSGDTATTSTNLVETSYPLAATCDFSSALFSQHATLELSQYAPGRRVMGRASSIARGSTGTSLARITSGCEINVLATITTIRLLMSTGNIVSGTFTLEGRPS